MSTYKVLQDIEAEDTLVGPLTLRQFIYAAISVICLYICFLALTRGAAFMMVFFLPIAVISGFFAFPWKGEQPTEIWALARLRFMVLPRTRIWNQSGIKEVVTITVPRKAPVRQHRNLSQYEVRSRLKALADTIDTRGWATRNANYQYYASQGRPQSDRLVNASGLQPGSIPMDAFLPSNDMLDDHSPVAQSLDALLSKSSAAQRQRVMQTMAQAQMPQAPLMPQPFQAFPTQPAFQFANTNTANAAWPQPSPQLPAPAMPMATPSFVPIPQTLQPQPLQPTQSSPPNDHWFLDSPGFPGQSRPQQPAQNTFTVPSASLPAPAAQQFGIQQLNTGQGYIAAADPTSEEQALTQSLIQQNQSVMHVNYTHLRVLQPSSDVSVDSPRTMIEQVQPPVTRQPDPVILELANNDDLNVATIARQANREIKKSPDEVEIRLH